MSEEAPIAGRHVGSGPHAARLRCVIQPHVFKANDIRGLVGGEAPEWDVAGARAIGAAFAAAFGLDGQEFVLGRDMRSGGRELLSLIHI